MLVRLHFNVWSLENTSLDYSGGLTLKSHSLLQDESACLPAKYGSTVSEMPPHSRRLEELELLLPRKNKVGPLRQRELDKSPGVSTGQQNPRGISRIAVRPLHYFKWLN